MIKKNKHWIFVDLTVFHIKPVDYMRCSIYSKMNNQTKHNSVSFRLLNYRGKNDCIFFFKQI